MAISSVIMQFYDNFSYILRGRGMGKLESNVTATKGDKNLLCVHIFLIAVRRDTVSLIVGPITGQN